ncbi:hypothetical protein MPSEU_000558200 [Mayamaea pseudoterrestris]|nr:hypothetical protein MPSEU_000558200 [Mayamaea pseudoterrestris]
MATHETHVHPSSRFTGTEPFLAGLSPCFWSHVPLMAAHINSLKLINGLNCIVVDVLDATTKLLPIQKVTMVGTIVCAERRSNGSVMYVLDDGTGFVDCMHWIENPFSLPSLTGEDAEDERRGAYSVGTLVKVMGRIECLAIHTDNVEKIGYNGHLLESQACVREIHATIVQDLSAVADAECRHWFRCQSLLRTNLNASEVLTTKLGSEIEQQVADRTNLPAIDDTSGEWRLFGTRCICQSRYKERLLYCHCQATMEPLDPHYRFRDYFLETLIELEASSSNDQPFRIQYKFLVGNHEIQSMALNVVGPTGDARRLLSNTVRCLRKDGILYLLCQESDTYLLVSADRVLKPYLQKVMSRDHKDAAERALLNLNRPEYLSNVPKARLDLVKRRLVNELRDMQERDNG